MTAGAAAAGGDGLAVSAGAGGWCRAAGAMGGGGGGGRVPVGRDDGVGRGSVGDGWLVSAVVSGDAPADEPRGGEQDHCSGGYGGCAQGVVASSLVALAVDAVEVGVGQPWVGVNGFGVVERAVVLFAWNAGHGCSCGLCQFSWYMGRAGGVGRWHDCSACRQLLVRSLAPGCL